MAFGFRACEKWCAHPAAVNMVKQKWTLIFALVSAVVISGSLLAPYAMAQSSASDSNTSDTLGDDGSYFNSWRIFLSARVLKNYLNYKTSGLYPVTEVTVVYKVRDMKTWEWQPQRTYEKFWFSNGKVIGLKRYEQLPLTADMSGNVVVLQTQDNSEQPAPIVGTVLQLYVELQLKNVQFGGVIVPKQDFDELSAELARHMFYPKQIISDEVGALLRMVAVPGGIDKYFFLRSG
jgi:hypothetical protein